MCVFSCFEFMLSIVVGLTLRVKKFIAYVLAEADVLDEKVSRILTGGISAFHAYKLQYKHNPGLQMQNLGTENPLVLLLKLGDTIWL